MLNKFFNDTKYAISAGILSLIFVAIVLSVFLIAKTMNLSEATISRYLVQGPFERLGQGSYKKINDYQNVNLSKW